MGSFREEALRCRIVTRREAEGMVGSFDLMGDIAVIDVPKALRKKEGKLGNLLLKLHKNLRTVARKGSEISGKYRIRKLKVIAGEKSLVASYRENGCAFRIDLGKVYFSPRQSFERERIALQVQRKERVLALFAGAGFYPIEIAKKQPDCEITAIELNPVAVKYLEDNARANKAGLAIRIIKGDVKKILRKSEFRKWATRAIMPLPHTAHRFLEPAINACKKGAMIHFYHIPEGKCEDAFKDAEEKIKLACKRCKRKSKIAFKRIVKTYAPHLDEVVVDFKLLD